MKLLDKPKSRVLPFCWVLIAVCLWFRFSAAGNQNCHCYAWCPPECPGCIAAPLVPGVSGSKNPIRVHKPIPGDVVTYSYGEHGWINHSAVYVGDGWCKGKIGAFPVMYHPLKFAFPYGTHYHVWRVL